MFGRFERIVRCKQGHLFETIWVPLASLKAVRLGGSRLQRCPVGHHWTRVSRVEESTLRAEELTAARSVHDLRVP